jgi:hypothetical protein
MKFERRRAPLAGFAGKWIAQCFWSSTFAVPMAERRVDHAQIQGRLQQAFIKERRWASISG